MLFMMEEATLSNQTVEFESTSTLARYARTTHRTTQRKTALSRLTQSRQRKKTGGSSGTSFNSSLMRQIASTTPKVGQMRKHPSVLAKPVSGAVAGGAPAAAVGSVSASTSAGPSPVPANPMNDTSGVSFNVDTHMDMEEDEAFEPAAMNDHQVGAVGTPDGMCSVLSGSSRASPVESDMGKDNMEDTDASSMRTNSTTQGLSMQNASSWSSLANISPTKKKSQISPERLQEFKLKKQQVLTCHTVCYDYQWRQCCRRRHKHWNVLERNARKKKNNEKKT